MKRAAALALALVLGTSDLLDAAVARDGQPVMGTVLMVTVIAADRDAAKALVDESMAEARRWDDALTIWRSEGELARLNRNAGSGMLSISTRLETGLIAMRELSKQSGGAFEPGVAMLPEHGDAHTHLRTIVDCLTITRSHVGTTTGAPSPTRSLNDSATASLDAHCALDPGGIGKGLALDAIAALLQSRGAKAAFLDFGGSSQTAISAPPANSHGWPVQISGLIDRQSAGTVLLKDSSLSTSRSGATDTKPIIDPRTRLPVPGPRLVTVLARSAAAADAWSTALVVLGEGGFEAARAAGLQVFLDGGDRKVVTTGFPFDHSAAPKTGRVENESQVPHDRVSAAPGTKLPR